MANRPLQPTRHATDDYPGWAAPVLFNYHVQRNSSASCLLDDDPTRDDVRILGLGVASDRTRCAAEALRHFESHATSWVALVAVSHTRRAETAAATVVQPIESHLPSLSSGQPLPGAQLGRFVAPSPPRAATAVPDHPGTSVKFTGAETIVSFQFMAETNKER
jgi:hypothetical protein